LAFSGASGAQLINGSDNRVALNQKTMTGAARQTTLAKSLAKNMPSQCMEKWRRLTSDFTADVIFSVCPVLQALLRVTGL
jgi:hypothetical protein